MTYVTPAGEIVISVAADEDLLSAAALTGLDLPFTCLQGWCIGCAGRVEHGRVDQSDALRVYQEDIDAGFVLLCSARPKSDVRVRTHQKDAMRRHRRKHGLPVPGG